MRAIFLASLLLQLTFQTFTTWYALHGTERFGVRPEDVTIGFIAWAVGGVIGALPAGMIGVRLGRRNAMLARIRGDGGLPARARPGDASGTGDAAARARVRGWTLPTVNAYPLFVEPIPRARRGVLAALFLLCMALGGAIGDPLNGGLFDLCRRLSAAVSDDDRLHGAGVRRSALRAARGGRGRHRSGPGPLLIGHNAIRR